ncbi:MAG: hypothetical protein ACLGSA_14785 [Acidobacteriota bacterium]
MGIKQRLFQVLFFVSVQLAMGAMGHAQQLSEGQAQFWLGNVLIDAGTAHALGQGAYAPPLSLAYDPTYVANLGRAPISGDQTAMDIFGLHWFTNLIVSSASANAAAQAPAALPGAFGAAPGIPASDQVQLFNARQQSTSAEELILNFLLNMNANDPRLNSGTPAAQTTQSVTQTTAQTGTQSSSSGSSGGHYGWLTSGMY